MAKSLTVGERQTDRARGQEGNFIGSALVDHSSRERVVRPKVSG